METSALNVQLRSETGKGVARKLRAKGQIPGVLYGTENGASPISLDPSELGIALKTPFGKNTILSIQVAGEASQNGKLAVLHEYQMDNIKGVFLHVDLLEIHEDKPLHALVPVSLIGKSVGVVKGGILQQSRSQIMVECLPHKLPPKLEIDISGVDLNKPMHIKDVLLPEGVKVIFEDNFTIATVIMPAGTEAGATAEGAEGTAASAA